MRIIARLDVKNEWVIKGIHLEGLRKVGDPVKLAQCYYETGAHELIFMDAVASLYDRNTLLHIIEKACEKVFIPITIGGGLRTSEDVANALSAGADKVAINTSAVRNIDLISEIASRYGSQCVIGSIEAKQVAPGTWEAYVDNGREPTGLDVLEWVRKLEQAGVGELLVTSIDQEGTKRGFDLALIDAVNEVTSRPVICSGGYGKPDHLVDLTTKLGTGAVACASAFHYDMAKPSDLVALIDAAEPEEVAA